MGYRRVEPAFCRGCGARWNPGHDACGSCGEQLVAAAPKVTDPYALPKLRAALAAGALVFTARWGLLLWMATTFAAEDGFGWAVTLTAMPAVLAAATVRWWMPGKRAAAPATPRWAWPVALALGSTAALVGVLDLGTEAIQFTVVGIDAALISVLGWVGLALAFVAITAEEIVCRGAIFEGVAAMGSERNAAIASGLWGALLSFSPMGIAVNACAAYLRLSSGSVLACVLLRWAALAVAAAVVFDAPTSLM